MYFPTGAPGWSLTLVSRFDIYGLGAGWAAAASASERLVLCGLLFRPQSHKEQALARTESEVRSAE